MLRKFGGWLILLAVIAAIAAMYLYKKNEQSSYAAEYLDRWLSNSAKVLEQEVTVLKEISDGESADRSVPELERLESELVGNLNSLTKAPPILDELSAYFNQAINQKIKPLRVQLELEAERVGRLVAENSRFAVFVSNQAAKSKQTVGELDKWVRKAAPSTFRSSMFRWGEACIFIGILIYVWLLGQRLVGKEPGQDPKMDEHLEKYKKLFLWLPPVLIVLEICRFLDFL